MVFKDENAAVKNFDEIKKFIAGTAAGLIFINNYNI